MLISIIRKTSLSKLKSLKRFIRKIFLNNDLVKTLNESQIFRIMMDGCLKVVAEAERGAREARDEVESVNDAYNSFLRGEVSFVIYSIYFSPYLICFSFHIFFREPLLANINIIVKESTFSFKINIDLQ